jgi:hypothetical protein
MIKKTLEEVLENSVIRIKNKKYNNDLSKLLFLNSRSKLNIPYSVISDYIGYSAHGTISHYINGRCKISNNTKINIDKLLVQSIHIMERIVKYSTIISKKDSIKINSLILEGKILHNPNYKEGTNNFYKPNENVKYSQPAVFMEAR